MGRLYFLLLFSALAMAGAIRASHANPGLAAGSGSRSRWLERVATKQGHRREPGCRRRPSVCYELGRFPPLGFGYHSRKLCCRNRCVDVSRDGNNCGICGVRCPFSWLCCNGMCVDTKASPFHCGACNNWCPFGSTCSHGMCGYAQQPEPFPFPFPFPYPFTKPRKHSPPSSPQRSYPRRP